MKKLIIASGAVLVASALALTATPANATPWDMEGNPSGNVAAEFTSAPAGIGHVTGWDAATSSRIAPPFGHSTGILEFSDGTTWYSAWCDTATAVDSVDNGASVVTCDPQIPETASFPKVSMPGGIEVTANYRFGAANPDGIVLARMFYEVTNTTGAEVTIPEVRTSTYYDLDEDAAATSLYGTAYTNNGPVAATTDPTGTTLRWINLPTFDSDGTTVSDGYTTIGAAWAGADVSYMRNTSGDMSGDVPFLEASSTNVVVPAGGSVYFAFYGVYALIPTGATNASAIYDATTAYMAIFDGPYEGELTAGMPEGITVLNWSGAPQLPNTGAADVTGFAALALVLAGLGIALVLVRRRTA